MKNVILITTDQQQAGAMGCVNPGYYTPHLDQLAAKSARFTGAISTSAQCSPSRATWMTGKFPHQVGVYQIGHVLDPAEWGIAKAFNRAGYETVYFGKWHLGLSAAAHEFQVTDYRTDGLELAGANPDPRFHSHKDAVTTAKALNYLDDCDGTTPFFMHISWYMPHPNAPEDQPFELIGRFADRFLPEEMPVPTSFFEDDLSGKPSFQRERSKSGESELTEELVRRDARRYRSMLALMDSYLGQLMAKLKEKRMLENTAILFTSDHGDMQGAHRLRLKGVLPYKELYNVPLILYVPWVAAKRKIIPDLVSTAAVAGTLLEVVGLPVPRMCEGGSLLPALKREAPLSGEHVFFEHYKAYWGRHPLIGVQTSDWKYVRYVDDCQGEMYDLKGDPNEIVNVAEKSEADAVRSQLRRLVEEWWDATGGFSRQAIEDPNSTWGK